MRGAVIPAVLAASMLAGCGTLPEPFYGDPGIEGAKLATPPPPVLIIPASDNALLSDDAARLYAGDLAAALVHLDVPSVAAAARKTDWRLTTTASVKGNDVIPAYAITGPDQKSYGAETGHPVDAADWANGNPAALNTAAAADALSLTRLLATVNATVQQSNPESLENRPARLYMRAVTGAPTDGNNALSLNVTRDLPGINTVLVDNPARADFVITAAVKSQPDVNNQILVQLVWTIRDSNNRIIGDVTQLHDLNRSDITPRWGDVAAAAASEAATGIREAITNATLKRKVG